MNKILQDLEKVRDDMINVHAYCDAVHHDLYELENHLDRADNRVLWLIKSIQQREKDRAAL